MNLCDLIFDCGCVSVWNGSTATCNVHNAAGPHCPWCSHPFTAGASAFLAVLAAQAWIALGPLPVEIGTRLVAAILAFPVLAGAMGWLHGTWYGYWG